MPGRVGRLAVLVITACCSKSEVKGTGTADSSTPGKPTFSLFALAEVRGQIGPCGCTSDPLGDISRTAKLIADARAAGPVLVVDAGSLLYAKDPQPAEQKAQENLKADLLAKIYGGDLQVAAVGLGPADIVEGVGAVRFPRLASNLEPSLTTPPLTAPRVLDVGGAKVGVFAVVGDGALKQIKSTDPIAAGKAAIADLRGKGAQTIVALVQATSKRDASEIVRGIGGIDIAVAGLGINAPEPERVEPTADKIGDAWLVLPANRGQIVSRVEIWEHGAGPLVDAVGPGAASARTTLIDNQLHTIDGELAKFAADKDADPGFVKAKKAERDKLVADKAQLAAHPLVPPTKGSYFTLEQIKIAKGLACDAGVQKRVTDYDRAAGEANVKNAASIAVPAAAKGQATYVGSAACSDCHDDQDKFWKKTVHAQAWKTLVDRGQQFDYDCIGCHVTGWDRPGGSNLAHNDNLRDIQCETCHGPGSIHVDKLGVEKPLAIIKTPKDDLCATQCHTKEHSDTFQHDAYLRDIVGKGHGEALRTKLGDGPTGHSLRSAALDKAGKTLGAGCTR